MGVVCRRSKNGRFLVESDRGDLFEYQVMVRNGCTTMRRISPPIWRVGPWPADAEEIASAARRAALGRARFDGFAV